MEDDKVFSFYSLTTCITVYVTVYAMADYVSHYENHNKVSSTEILTSSISPTAILGQSTSLRQNDAKHDQMSGDRRIRHDALGTHEAKGQTVY